jgi:hypothetical protein
MPQRHRPSPAWKRIRALFGERRAAYAPADVPGLIGIAPSVLQQAVAEGVIEPGAVPWDDVVALGLEHRWTVRMLTEALRGAGLAALPPLVRTVAGRVVLPRHQWQLLRFLAADRARTEHREITASDLLEEAVSTALLTQIQDWTRLEAALPGVRAAAAWPSSD